MHFKFRVLTSRVPVEIQERPQGRPVSDSPQEIHCFLHQSLVQRERLNHSQNQYHLCYTLCPLFKTNKIPRMCLLCQSPLTHHVPDVVNALRTVGHCGGSEVYNYINTVQFLAQTDCFVFYRHEPQGLIWFCLCMLGFVSQSRGSHRLPLYDWQTWTGWVKNLEKEILLIPKHKNIEII